MNREQVFLEAQQTYEKKIADLESKLAESEWKNFELLTKLNLKEYAPAFCTLADRDCEALGQVKKLKQQLAESKEENKKLVKALNGDIFINYKVPMENAKLKQQLHDLPKKIVCEISESIERLSWRKRIYTNWEFDKEQLYKDLDTILKKYGANKK